MLDDIRVAWVAWAILIACMIAPWLPKKPYHGGKP